MTSFFFEDTLLTPLRVGEVYHLVDVCSCDHLVDIDRDTAHIIPLDTGISCLVCPPDSVRQFARGVYINNTSDGQQEVGSNTHLVGREH